MRVPHCRRTPPGCTPEAPAPIAVRSKTATRAPRACNSRAIASPTTPAPTTATSRLSRTFAQVCERLRAEADLRERRGTPLAERRLRHESHLDCLLVGQREMAHEPPEHSVGRGVKRELASDACDPQPDGAAVDDRRVAVVGGGARDDRDDHRLAVGRILETEL